MQDSFLPKIKQFARAIKKEGSSQGYWVQEVDALLHDYYAQGYKLFATHVIDNSPQEVLILYILELQS